MKSKKMLLILFLAVALVIGWFVSVRAATGKEAIREQEKLVAEANEFLDRKLYVRAIALYEEAMQMENTILTNDIQEKLLSAYESYGDMVSYTALVSKRISAETAVEAEYIKAAEYYFQKSDPESAIAVLKEGLKRLDSQVLRDFYEKHRYAYRLRTTKYEEVLPSADNTWMPAFDGKKWGYIGTDGREKLPFVYDSVTAFNNYGYAVVRWEETFYTILENGDWYGADDGSSYSKMTDVQMVSNNFILGQRDGSYSYYNYDFEPMAASFQYSGITGNSCGVAAVEKDGKWGIITDSGEIVVDFILEDVAVNSLGCAFAGDRAMVKENGKWHLMDTKGNRIGNKEYADAKAPESDGYIAVADETGKWGFIDYTGEQVIACEYNDAISFSQHLGAVKIVNDWGYISESNELVIDEPFQSAFPFHNGVAQGRLTEGTALILLNYFED